MNTIKKLIAVVTLAAAVVAASVQHAEAQLVGPTTVVVNANVTSNAPVGVVTIDCRGQQNIPIKWTVNLAGAGTEVMGVRFQPSADGSTLPTTPTAAYGYTMAIAANGTTPVVVTTNFATLGFPFLHLYYATNGNATYAMTNKFEYWVSKTGAK
jgi:hypothetical protein